MGGGPGGLLTAFFLGRTANRPLRVTIFEAADRLGGKVLTPSFAAAPVRYEAGAAELYDYSPVGEDPLRDLVAELGLPTVPLGGATVVIDDAGIANLDDLADALGPAARRAVQAFDLRARGTMTPREFYASDDVASPLPGPFTSALAGIRHPAARRYVEAMIHSDLATEPDLTSVSYGLQNYLMNDPRYMRLYSIAGGNEQLIERLADGTAMDVCLQQRVLSVEGVSGGRLRLRIAFADEISERDFDTVVLCLPMLALAAVE
ncbi:MAG: FAD-dependent oxidoreductase, partial [Planctomycetaceae bacterium]